MKTINVDSHNVPATARSRNYQTALATTASSGGGATTPSTMTPTGGAADTAKVAQNLAEDSTDWAKILRKDIDERTENSLSIGKNITVDGQALLNDVVANTGTFGGLLKAAAATITGALLASTVSATTMTANTFIGDLIGNANTATRLQTPRTIWGQSFDGTGNVTGNLSLGINIINQLNNGDSNGEIIKITRTDNSTPRSLASDGFGIGLKEGTNYTILARSGRVAIGLNTISTYKLDVNGTMRASDGARFDKGAIFLGQTTAPTGLGTYVLNYVSSTYGARVTAYDGTNYQKLNIGKLISGTNFQLELNTDGTSKFNGGVIASGMESSKGGLFYGQYATMPTGLGTYVANYVSDAYGARVLAYDGAAYKDLKLGAMPTSGIFGLSLNANGDTRVGYNIGTSNFASHTTGWNVSAQGAADFRNIYADELRVQAFTADISQALAGSDYLTKSVSKLSANFVVPAVNSTVRIIVDDIEGMPAAQCFSNGDYIRFRAFNRTSGLTIANVWGTVALDTTFGTNGFNNGTQAYTFTCKATTGAGLTVFKGSEVLDYGTSGSGMISRTTLDAQGSPYEQIATWVSDPSVSANYTVHARLGNLGGIANCSGYGLYTDNGFFTGKIVIGDLTKTANYLSFDTVNGLQIKLGGTSVATTTDVSNSLTTANTNAQGYANTAQTNAINTASSDATTKANTAYNSAVDYTNTQITATNNSITAVVNGIQIADRNILQKSYLSPSRATYNSTTHTWSGVIATTGDSYWRWDLTSLMNEQYVGKITISFIAKSTVAGNIYVNPTTYYASYKTIAITTSDAYYSVVIDADFLNHSGWGGFSFAESLRGATVTIKEIMISKGSVALPYRPAIEDIESNINTAQSTAISKAASNAAALYVTQTAYSSQVNILKDSINAKVSQTDFNELGTRVSTAESNITQNTTDIGLKVSKDGVIGAINLTSEAATIQASKINLVGAVTISSISSDALNTIQGYSTTAVNNLSNAHGNFTYIDGNSVYTGTLTAGQVNAVAINASSVTTGTLSADRIGANTITFDKLVGTDITALGNVIAGSFNIGSGKFIVDPNGNLTAVNATLSGTITATAGKVGPFDIGTYLSATNGSDNLILNADLIRFTKGSTSAVYMGGDVMPGTLGGLLACPMRIEETRSTTGTGNAGIYISVTGAAIDDSDDYASNSALYIAKGVISGLRPKIRRLGTSQTLSIVDHTIIDISSSYSTYTFPSNCEDGQEYVIYTTNLHCGIKSNNSNIQFSTNAQVGVGIVVDVYDHLTLFCVYDAYNNKWFCRDTRQS